MPPGLVSRRELAALLGVSTRTLYRQLPFLPLTKVSLPGHPRWLRADVDRFLSGVTRHTSPTYAPRGARAAKECCVR